MGTSTMQPVFVTTLIGPVQLVTAATAYPVTLGEAKAQAIVTIDDDDQTVLRKLKAATRYCERLIGVQIMSATYDVPIRGWWNGLLRMPRQPLQSATWLKYYDPGGTLTELDSSKYIVTTPQATPGYIERAPTETWPNTDGRFYPIIARIVAGFASAAVVPETVKEAVLMTVAHFYENREAVLTGTIAKELDIGVKALLQAEFARGYA